MTGMTTPPPQIQPGDAVTLDICFQTGGCCDWQPLPVPAVNAWQRCAACRSTRYRSRGGWTRVAPTRRIWTSLGDGYMNGPLRALWRRCTGPWAAAYPFAVGHGLYPGVARDD